MQAAAGKLFLFLRAPEGTDPRRFQEETRAGLAGAPWDKAALIGFCRVQAAPAGLPRRPDDPAVARPVFDAAIWAKFAETAQAQAAFDLLSTQQAKAEIFLVREIPVLDRLAPGELPAIKNLALITFHEDLPDSAAQRSWAQHAKLAESVHLGAGRYRRNWVEARNKSARPARGIVEIDFASLADLVERYFAPPDGMARIIQDTGHFVQSAVRLYMQEEIVPPLRAQVSP
jgi:hypothetical protein